MFLTHHMPPEQPKAMKCLRPMASPKPLNYVKSICGNLNVVPELIHGKECLTAPSTQEMLRTQLEEEDAVQHRQRIELSDLITATVNPGLCLDRYRFSDSFITWSVRESLASWGVYKFEGLGFGV